MEIEYTPIAIKDFGIDPEYNLSKKIYIHSLNIDAKREVIMVNYDVVLISSTNKIVSILKPGSYVRLNSTNNNNKFDQLRQSEIGIGITELIEGDMNMINSFDTIDFDLKQIM